MANQEKVRELEGCMSEIDKFPSSKRLYSELFDSIVELVEELDEPETSGGFLQPKYTVGYLTNDLFVGVVELLGVKKAYVTRVCGDDEETYFSSKLFNIIPVTGSGPDGKFVKLHDY